MHSSISKFAIVNCKAKKKQHACVSSGLHNHYSELFTQITALKFKNSNSTTIAMLLT